MKTLATNPFLESVRAAYRRSPHYHRITDGGMSAGGGVGNLIPSEPTARKHGEDPTIRQPGQDDEETAADLPLGIGRDSLEQEFMDAAQP